MSTGCNSDVTEPFALRVIGDSMTPEFEDGAIIIVDPAAPCENGAYAVVEHNGEIVFRQYVIKDEGKYLQPLNHDYDTVLLTEPYEVRGVVIQQTHKRKRKHYDWSPKFTA
jgi:SOS-response transcriptional repressor LexA